MQRRNAPTAEMVLISGVIVTLRPDRTALEDWAYLGGQP